MRAYLDLSEVTALEAAGWGLAYFTSIYFGFAIFHGLVHRWVMAKLGWGRRLNERPIYKDQIWKEMGWSGLSILVFGVGLIVPWWMVRQGWAHVMMDAPWSTVVLELLALVAWNDVHFYATHRLLHSKWAFPRFHIQHHKSVVTTPFSTYAFHPVEAAMLGNVLLLPMAVHDFSVQALVALPLVSLWFNSIGHVNWDPWPRLGVGHPLTSGRRHALHHARFNGNYGFLFPVVDAWMGTALEDTPLDV